MSDGPFSFGGSPVVSHASQHSRHEKASQFSGTTGGHCAETMSAISSAAVFGDLKRSIFWTYFDENDGSDDGKSGPAEGRKTRDGTA